MQLVGCGWLQEEAEEQPSEPNRAENAVAGSPEGEAEEEVARTSMAEKARLESLDAKKIEERNGYEKRLVKTGEDFRTKEKRKRSMGQQGGGSNYVEEEKRRVRHTGGNFDD